MLFIFQCSVCCRIPPVSSPGVLGDPAMASTAALLGLHSRPDLSPSYLAQAAQAAQALHSR